MVIELFYILIVVMVTQLYTSEKDYTICKSHFNKKRKRIFIPFEIPPDNKLE